MAITLDTLKAFVTAAQLGNFSKAATRLGLTQPALSWSMRKLEQEIGAALFVRTKKGVHLTRSGQKLLDRSHELTRTWEDLVRGLAEDKETIAGVYRLGIHRTVAAFTLPRFWPTLWRKFPGIDLQLTHDLSRNVAEGVIQFHYDFGIVVNPPEHPDLIIVDLYPDFIQFWRGPSSDEDKPPESPVLIVNPDMPQTEGLVAEGRASGLFAGARIVRTTELTVIANLTATSGGFGLLPTTVALALNLGLTPLPNSPTHHDRICLIWRADLQRGRTSKVIRETITEAFAKAPVQLGMEGVIGSGPGLPNR